MPDPTAAVGVIANPAAATDIRRVTANATGMPIGDRANTVLRVMAALGACGVPRVLMMPEDGGIRRHLTRSLERERNQGHADLPRLHFTDTPVTGTVEDTFAATRAMVAAGVVAIVVLGGDGTHRAVAACCGGAWIVGISTGTNNAFPEQREPTVTGLAVGLTVTGRVPAATALVPNKLLQVTVNGSQQPDVALVDVCVTTESCAGAVAERAPARDLRHLRRSRGDRPVRGRRTPASRGPARAVRTAGSAPGPVRRGDRAAGPDRARIDTAGRRQAP